jgi:hypothetical protein
MPMYLLGEMHPIEIFYIAQDVEEIAR